MKFKWKGKFDGKNERGVYRVEVCLTQPGSLVKAKPWVISNPIYNG